MVCTKGYCKLGFCKMALAFDTVTCSKSRKREPMKTRKIAIMTPRPAIAPLFFFSLCKVSPSLLRFLYFLVISS